jgi:hypothetical protein
MPTPSESGTSGGCHPPPQVRRHGLRRKFRHQRVERHHLRLLFAQPPHGDGAVLDLLAADGEDHGDLADRMLADLVVDLLVADVGLGAQARLGQGRHGLVHEIIGLRHDGGHDHLPRREPEGQLAGVVLDQDADEALERAEDRAVQHHRAVLSPSGPM